MNLFLFIVVLMVSFVIVRIGGTAFELTGLEPSLARFQALSCFTGTGFTTKEAELITGYPQRRRIATVLIVVGHAGLVTLIATFANTLRANEMVSNIRIPFLHQVLSPRALPLVNLAVILVTVYAVYKISTHAGFTRKFTGFLRAHMVKKEIVKRVSFEELVVATGGYGISQIEISKDSPVLDKTLRETDLRKMDISVLAIERGTETIPNPPADTKITLGDKLICFGKLDNIRKSLCLVPV